MANKSSLNQGGLRETIINKLAFISAMRRESAMSQRQMLYLPFPPRPSFPALAGTEGDGAAGLRPAPDWGLRAPDPRLLADAFRFNEAGCRAEPCSVWAKPRT